MDIKYQYIPYNRTKQRPKIDMWNPEYITIHSTGNPDSTAQNEADYVCYNSDRQASFHYVCDDKQIICVLPPDEVAWHAGDGRNGTGNTKSIAIEICESGDRKKAVMNTVKLTKFLMDEHNIPIDHVVQHNKWSGKNCPRILRDNMYIKDGINWVWFVRQLMNMEEDEKEGEEVEEITYKTLSDIPDWGKDAVKWAIENHILNGVNATNLGLNQDQLKSLVFIYRYQQNVFKKFVDVK